MAPIDSGLSRIQQISMRVHDVDRAVDIKQAHETLASRGVTFKTAPHKIATLADREVWLADFADTEGNTLALMSEPRIS